MIIIGIILAIFGGMILGRLTNGLALEWFGRVGTIITGILTLSTAPNVFIVAFLAGYIFQSILRLNYISKQEKQIKTTTRRAHLRVVK